MQSTNDHCADRGLIAEPLFRSGIARRFDHAIHRRFMPSVGASAIAKGVD